jgi:RHS repeat-associated protein
MRSELSLLLCLVLVWPHALAFAGPTKVAPVRPSAPTAVEASAAPRSFYFEPNLGQSAYAASFLLKSSGLRASLYPSRLSLEHQGQKLEMDWVGASSRSIGEGQDSLAGLSSYVYGSDASRWVTAVPHFAQVRYPNLYPGIDVLYYGNEGKLEFDLVVAPGARADAALMRFKGAVRLDKNGDLVTSGARWKRPVAYQESGSGRQEIAASYQLSKEGVRFAVGAYDHSLPLVIDPIYDNIVIFDGAEDEVMKAMATDGFFFYYLCETNSPDFPGASSVGRLGGGTDLVAIKYDPRKKLIVWATYIGGTLNESGGGIAVDSTGRVTVSGVTASQNFPTTSDAQQRGFGGGTSDAFLFSLGRNGALVNYSTYLGGSGNETNALLGSDSQGSVYVTGTTTGNFPVSTPAYQSAFGGVSDVFLAKFTGSTMMYSTYIGGSGADEVADITVDPSGIVYLGGSTGSSNFPTSASAPQRAIGGKLDGFLTKVAASGGTLVYSTFIGGNDDDAVRHIFVSFRSDQTRDRLWAGINTKSTNMTTTAGAFLPSYSGGLDGFLVQLAPPGTIQWASYLGGAGDDQLGPIFADERGEVSVAFTSTSSNWGRSAQKFEANGPRSIETIYEILARMSSNFGRVLSDEKKSSCLTPGSTGALRNANQSSSAIQGFTGAASQLGAQLSCSLGSIGAILSSVTAGLRKSAAAASTTAIPTTFPKPALYKLSSVQKPSTGVSGDPVATATGEAFDSFTDMILPGPLTLAFQRYYGSNLSSEGVSGALGRNWTHNFDEFVETTPTEANFSLFPGVQLLFRRTAATAPWTLSNNVQGGYQLISSGNELKLLEYESNLVRTFNANGQLTRIEDRNGNAFVVTQGAAGPTRVTDGVGRTFNFTYVGGLLTRLEDGGGRSLTFEYTGPNLTGFTNQVGRKTTYSYNPLGRLSALTLPIGQRPANFAYDAQGRVITQGNALGNETKFAYAAGSTTITDALGQVSRHGSATEGELTGITDESGKSAAASYDASGNMTALTDRAANAFRQTFHAPTGYLQSFTDAAGLTTTYTYVAQTQGGFTYFVQSRVAYPDNTSQSMTHDARGNITSLIERDGSESKFAYNTRGLVTSMTYADGGVIAFEYAADGSTTSVTLPGGEKTAFTNDAQRRMVKSTASDATTTEFTYDAKDRNVRDTNPLGTFTVTTFDANDWITSVTDRLGKRVEFTRDSEGNVTQVLDRTGGKQIFTYDKLDRMLSMAKPSGRKVTYTYDSRGRITTMADDLGPFEVITYDDEDLPLTLTDALGRTMRMQYDKRGQVTALTTANNEVIRHTYDNFGNMVSVTDANGRVLQLVRDAKGRITKSSVGSTSMEHTYSPMGHLLSTKDPSGNLWTSKYDTSGRRVSSTDPLGRETAYQFDARGRTSNVTLPEGTLAMEFDAEGSLMGKKYSDGLEIRFDRDALRRTTKANGIEFAYDDESRITNSNGLAITRDPDGRVATIAYAADKVVKYAYDQRGRVSTVEDWLGGITTIGYNAADEVISITRPNQLNAAFTYDPNGKIASVAEGTVATIAIQRDPSGRILEAERNLPTLPSAESSAKDFTFDAAHQRTDATYDRMGRIIQDGNRTFTWDLESRLTSITEDGVTQTFTYDAYGHLTGWNDGTVNRQFVQNYSTTLVSPTIEKRDGVDANYNVFLPGGQLLYSVDAASNARTFHHFDEAGNAIFLSNDAGEVVESFGISPYGEIVSSTGKVNSLFVYQGAFGVMNLGKGLYQMRARVYDAASARFLSQDPIGRMELPAASPYVYALANPLLYSDPTGEWGIDLGAMWNNAVNAGKAVVGGAVKVVKVVAETTVKVAKAVVDTTAKVATATYNFAAEKAAKARDAAKAAAQWVAARAAEAARALAALVTKVATNLYGNFSNLLNKGVRISLPAPPSRTLSKLQLAAVRSIIQKGGDVMSKLSAAGYGNLTLSQISAMGGGNSMVVGGARVLSHNGSTLTTANVIALGGGNFTVADMMKAGRNASAFAGNSRGTISTLNFMKAIAPIISDNSGGLIGNDGSTLIGNDGSTLIGMDGSTLIGNDGSTFVQRYGGLVGNDGGS